VQEKLTIARPYASAAFGFAEEHGQISQWAGMLEALAGAVNHPEMQPLIGHPKVAKKDLFDLLKAALEMTMGSTIDVKQENFLQVLVDAERIQLAPEIAELFERAKTAAEGVVDVSVISAYEVSDAEQDKIAEAIRARSGQQCEVRSQVDESLIGGAIIRVGDSVIDISLKGRLQALTQRLG